jgi:hypothetical protein
MMALLAVLVPGGYRNTMAMGLCTKTQDKLRRQNRASNVAFVD